PLVTLLLANVDDLDRELPEGHLQAGAAAARGGRPREEQGHRARAGDRTAVGDEYAEDALGAVDDRLHPVSGRENDGRGSPGSPRGDSPASAGGGVLDREARAELGRGASGGRGARARDERQGDEPAGGVSGLSDPRSTRRPDPV